MKRLMLTLFVTFMVISVHQAQVFNSAQTLKKGSFSVGIEPAVLVPASSDFYLFLHGGLGIKSGMDLSLKAGLGDGNYFGADLEFSLAQNLSLAVGAHNFIDFGLDGCFLFNIPIKGDINLYSGIDIDLDVPNDLILRPWIPVGLEIYLKKNMAMLFEAEIGLNNHAYHMFGGGLSFYF